LLTVADTKKGVSKRINEELDVVNSGGGLFEALFGSSY
jgi:hypothetical protein